MAWGENKADIVRDAVEGPETEAVSASFLQSHPDARFLVDAAAGENADARQTAVAGVARRLGRDEHPSRGDLARVASITSRCSSCSTKNTTRTAWPSC